jgi:hypothetical protein
MLNNRVLQRGDGSFELQLLLDADTPGTYHYAVQIANTREQIPLGDETDPAWQTAFVTVTVLPALLVDAPFGTPISLFGGAQSPTVTLAYFTQGFIPSVAAAYSETIDWGDGSTSAGNTLPFVANDQYGNPFPAFAVEGSHTYWTPGSFAPRVLIRSPDGQTATATLNVNVVPASFPLTGSLDPSSDTGVSSADGITDDNTPTFRGATLPNAAVTVIVTAAGAAPPAFVGQTRADASGSWSLTTTTLPDGKYSLEAYADGPNGEGRKSISVLPGGLVIDTAPPSAYATSFNSATGRVVLEVLNDPAGVDASSLRNASSFVLKSQGSHPRSYSRPRITVTPGKGGDYSIVATFNRGHRLVPGQYAVAVGPVAIFDLAGNASRRVIPV